MPAARREAQRLQGEADAALAEAEALKLQARLEDLHVWEMKMVKQRRKGPRTYTYWMASWREGGKTRNLHLWIILGVFFSPCIRSYFCSKILI